MPKEIEHKFLVISDKWRSLVVNSIPIQQAYIYTGPPLAVRVRIEPDKCTLNLKKAIVATEREEFEYAIPREDAVVLMEHFSIGYIIEKIRHIVWYQDQRWEIDEFLGVNEGLIIAEVELEREKEINTPPWIGKEVSHDPCYLNSHLTLHPYKTWQ